MAARLSVGRAIEAWQPFYKEPLSQADGEEIVETMSAYLRFISEWVSKQKKGQGV
jgi:hypothetical protein